MAFHAYSLVLSSLKTLPLTEMSHLCVLNLDLTIRHAKVGGHGFLCLQVLAEPCGLVAVEAVEEANLDDTGDLEQFVG